MNNEIGHSPHVLQTQMGIRQYYINIPNITISVLNEHEASVLRHVTIVRLRRATARKKEVLGPISVAKG